MVRKQIIPEMFWSVKQIDIFRDLSDADANALAQLTTFKHLKNGEPLCAEGVYLLKEGRVKIYETPPEGEAVTLEVLEPGEIFGAIQSEDDKVYPNVTAETLTEVVVGIIKVKNFQYFLKRKPHLAMPPPKTLGRLLKKHLQAWISRLPTKPRNFSPATSRSKSRSDPTNALLNIAFRSPASRLALLLQHYADAPKQNQTLTGHGSQCTLRKLSTRKLAQLIGSSVEKTETLLNQFKQHKVLEKRFRRIQILDPWQLKKIAKARMETLPPIQEEKNETYEQDEPLFAARPADGR
jgi:CRP-like cAMP-binding protein